MIIARFDEGSLRRISALLRRVERAKAFGDNRTALTTEMRDEQAKTWVQNFPSGARYGGYQGLSERTIANRVSEGWSSGPPLIRSGFLQRTVNRQSQEGKPSNDGVSWRFYNYNVGSNIGVFPVVHNNGSRNIPSRKFWDLNDADRTMHEERAEKWLHQLGRIVIGG